MIEKKIGNLLSVPYEKKILIFDYEKLIEKLGYLASLDSKDFKVLYYEDVEKFRLLYEQKIKHSNEKWIVIVTTDVYVPFDIRRIFFSVELNMNKLFPKLNPQVMSCYLKDIDIISCAYDELYSDCSDEAETDQFIKECVFGKQSILKYCKILKNKLLEKTAQDTLGSNEWTEIAKIKAKAEYYSAMIGNPIDLKFVDKAFQNFVMDGYQKLSSQMNSKVPVILPKVMAHITNGRDKVALIVMDGMSLVDFEIISHEFTNIEYDLQCSFALIPTTTAISRQCLLSGKYPSQLESPFNLSKEEKEFRSAAENLGYTKQQTLYARGYEPQIGPFIKMVSIIINDIDDMVHGQIQGRTGMFNDVSLLAKQGKLQHLIVNLNKQGFKVFITADHGNTLCHGIGMIKGTGVEVETKSKRMLVLKDFASSDVKDDKSILKYPGYYLDKQYQYIICNTGISFDTKGAEVMTHGGISIDEVIVPFIKIKAVHHG